MRHQAQAACRRVPVSSNVRPLVNIRQLHSSDLNALLALYRHLHVNDLPLPERPEVERVWQEALLNDKSRYFGGFEDDALVASCLVVVVPNLTRGCRPYGLIENDVTHEAYRGRGWGKRILQEALAFAWSLRCYKVMLLTGRRDEATLRFYEGAGFSREGKTGFIAKPPERAA